MEFFCGFCHNLEVPLEFGPVSVLTTYDHTITEFDTFGQEINFTHVINESTGVDSNTNKAAMI